MGRLKFKSCCLVLLLSLDMQSLVDVAREEAERRKALEQQGIQAKVIEGNGNRPAENRGNVTTSAGPPIAPERTDAREDSPKSRVPLRRYRAALKKLDRAIQQAGERLSSRQARLQSEKWTVLKKGRTSGRAVSSQSRIQSEIEEIQSRLKRLREERLEVYESGKKAGFLPGELEGKGLVP